MPSRALMVMTTPHTDGSSATSSRSKHFVREGGSYLGILYGRLLGEPGHFNLFRGRVDEYYSSSGASA
jgi:hypothetical protein